MRLFFDVSALPEVGCAVTGISRVVLSVLVELVRLESSRCEIYGISFRPEEMGAHPGGRLWTLGEIAACGGILLRATEIPIEVSERSPGTLRTSDVIVCLGEQWLFPATLPALNQLKAEKGVRVITLVHDLVPFFMPELYWSGFPESYQACLTALVRCSDVVLVYSENTRRDLYRWIPEIANKPVSLLHLGAELSAQPEVTDNTAAFPKGNYVLCVSTIQPRKNHGLLLMTWRLLLARRRGDCPQLVLVGKKGWNSDDLLYFFAHHPDLRKLVSIVEQPSDAGLRRLYQNSWLTVYPSLYEGWGLPISESLAAGKLCLSSDSSSMPEAGGELAEYFSPYDPMGLCNLIEKYLDDPAALAAAEARIRTSFVPSSWRQCALELLLAAGGSHEM